MKAGALSGRGSEAQGRILVWQAGKVWERKGSCFSRTEGSDPDKETDEYSTQLSSLVRKGL